MSSTQALHPKRGLALPKSLARLGQRIEVTHVILVLVTAFLVYQVIVPLCFLIWGSLKTVGPTHDAYLTLQVTLENYARAFQGGDLLRSLGNTLIFAIGSTVFSAFLGVVLALIVARTDLPFKGLINVLAYARIIMPGLLTSIAWVMLGSPQIGVLNRLYKDLTGSPEALFSIYSLGGMIWVQGLDTFPLVYLTMLAALRSMDPSLEEAAFMSNKPVTQTLLRITFPLMRPALLASGILVLIFSIESFEVPLILGLPEKIFVLSTEIYFKSTRTPTDFGMAAAFGVILLILSLGLLIYYQRATRNTAAYQTVTGKAFRPRVIPLGAWRWPAFAFAFLVMFFSVILPTLILLWASLLRFFQPPSLRALENASLNNYQQVLTSSTVHEGVRNSLILAISSATIVVLLVAVIAWMVYRTRLPGRHALDMLAFAPRAVPAVLFGVSMLWLYLVLPIPIYGTIFILLLAYITRYMPNAMRIVSAGIVQVHRELEEAAYAAGAPWTRMFRKVLLPLMQPVLVTAWIWVAVHAFRELSVSAILASPGNRTVAVAIFELWTEGSFGLISAFSVVVLVFLLLLAFAAERIGRRFGISGVR